MIRNTKILIFFQVAVPYVTNTGVSSTTTSASGSGTISVPISVPLPIAVQGPELLTPVAPQSMDESTAMSLSQQQAQMLFASPNNQNTQQR